MEIIFYYFRCVFLICLIGLSGCVSSKKNSDVDGLLSNLDADAISTEAGIDNITTASIKRTKNVDTVDTITAKPTINKNTITKDNTKVTNLASSVVSVKTESLSDELVVRAPPDIESTESKSENSSQLEDTYLRIVNAALTKESFAEEALLRSSEHALSAHKQGLFPQIRPGASVNAEGDSILQLNVEQVLFDSGHHTAGRKVLLGQRSAAEANYRVEQNERATNAIATYIEYHRLSALQQNSKEILAIFKRYQDQSQQRIYSGIGDSSESDLFLIKKLQAEADYERFESERYALAEDFKRITGISMITKSPVRLGIFKEFHNSPELALIKAEQDEAIGNLELDRANRKPRVSLTGNVGAATDSFDEENMDLRVEVSVNQPLNWGVDHSLAESQSNLNASKIRYSKAVRESEDEIKKLLLELDRAESSVKRLTKLEKAAAARVKGFNRQFLAGKASISEAASVIDSYKQIKTNLKETQFRIFSIELEIASISGFV